MDISQYGSAIEKVLPGSFVPDIAPQGGGPQAQPLPDDAAAAATPGTSFKDTVKSLLNDVNTQMVTAEQKSTDVALGKSNDLEGTVKSVEEAGLAMQYTLAVRNKLLDAYTEISRMQF
jgi:flagellar hook-basal body complex protein FliE